MKYKKYLFIGAVSLLFIADFLIWQKAFDRANPRLSVVFLNIGQGDAIYIEAPNGNQMLVDAGGNKSILRELGRVMPFFDRSIDAVIATHPDKDHIGGFQDVLDRYKVDLILESGVKSKDTKSVLAIEDAVREKNIYKLLARRGMKVDFGGGTVFQIFFPDRDVSGVDSNDASIVGKLIYGAHTFLLTGDSPQKIEDYLVEQNSGELKSDVLKAGHHGSRTSSSEPFARAVSPDFAIISAGKNNSYGHPHKEVMELFEKLKIKTFETAKLGRIIFKSDGVNLDLN